MFILEMLIVLLIELSVVVGMPVAIVIFFAGGILAVFICYCAGPPSIPFN